MVYNKKILTSILFLLISYAGMVAQNAELPQPQPMGAPTPPGPLPIDDGLIILVAVAIIYGVYRSLKLAKKSTEA